MAASSSPLSQSDRKSSRPWGAPTAYSRSYKNMSRRDASMQLHSALFLMQATQVLAQCRYVVFSAFQRSALFRT